MGLHVLDPEVRIVGPDGQGNTPVAHEGIREVGGHDDIIGIMYVQLIVLVGVSRQLEVDPIDRRGKAAGRVVADLHHGKPAVAVSIAAAKA